MNAQERAALKLRGKRIFRARHKDTCALSSLRWEGVARSPKDALKKACKDYAGTRPEDWDLREYTGLGGWRKA